MHQTGDVDFLLDRFTHERHILAALDHPNIARLLDAGRSAEGVPYVVMEYVDGLPIDTYCLQNGLSTKARLELFCRVCATVHHAHQRSVIHRDLKPANILVTDGGIPKLLDFGIAKLVEPGRGDPSTTRTLYRVLTPASAAPEQVTGRPMTPATDVYALGVPLCQLVSGRLPYDLLYKTDAELAKAICETAPEKPSALVGRSPGFSGAQSAVLRNQLVGDIDTIVLKALRKEPERRYASAADLAEDIVRHLEGLPGTGGPRHGSIPYAKVPPPAAADAGCCHCAAWNCCRSADAVAARRVALRARGGRSRGVPFSGDHPLRRARRVARRQSRRLGDCRRFADPAERRRIVADEFDWVGGSADR